MNIRYKLLDSNDEVLLRELFQLYTEVFDTPYAMPEASRFRYLLSADHLLFIAAIQNDRVAGGLTAHILPSLYSEASEVYVYDLAVAPAVQRKGIGKQLLATLNSWCSTHRVKGFFVQAAITDQHAVDFYQATGGTPEKVIHFSYATEN
ncbi:GNAT family N-acetyltransferase [Niabella beijingensis]|uniref:GNAT family N-acetyltransferase n=1 Tax=Niabella beijingensis TaxID=2872700 RepID=UPI001CBE14BC|nr:GNAT family N-acetyltransferase [Niabella beijingensis]MBZ4188336.1 GNAT family N-acetyltransferase [Niabella beijingensis]